MTTGSLRGLSLLLGGLLLSSVAYAANLNSTDPLNTPSVQSGLASRTQLVEVVRAGKRLVAVGWRGHIVYSDDEGKSWVQTTVPVSADLTAVYFPTPEQGWAVGHGGVILHTSDGGKTWMKQQDGVTTAKLMLEYYEQRAKKSPEIARYVNDIKLNYQYAAEQPWLGVWFENERHGLVVGTFNLIMETLDGGGTWTPLLDKVDNPAALHLDSITEIDGDLYIASEKGNVFRRKRGSENFVAVATGYTGSFFGVLGGNGLIVAYGLRGNAYCSHDGGKTWEKAETGTNTALTGGTVLDDGRILLVTQGGQLLLADSQAMRFSPVKVARPALFAGVADLHDGRVVVIGAQGAQVETLTASGR